MVLTALAVPDALADLGLLSGDGWTSLSLGIGFAVLWVAGRIDRRRRGWALWMALVFGLIGVTQLSNQVPWLPDLDVFWPVLFIGAGLIIVLGANRPAGSRR